MRLGDVECRKEEFTNALKEYKIALLHLSDIDDNLRSRRMAEVYFTLGNTYLYEFKEKALENAIVSYKGGEKIIRTLHKEEMMKPK